jgi:intracellular sulfur oxidation DsrE/DsrF family protein
MHQLFKVAAIGAAGLAIVFVTPNITQSQTGTTSAPKRSAWNQTHRVIIQVTQNDPAVMNLALNNAENLVNFYKGKGEQIQIEMVAFGAGLNMVRDDTSPVKERLTAIAHGMKNVTFSGCDNTLAKQSKQENKEITLVPEAHLVPAGIARVVELEEQGWTYVRP